MSGFKNFQDYLQKTYATPKGDGNGFSITHTRMGNKYTKKEGDVDIWGGSYTIPNDKYEKVMKKYYKYVIEDGNDEYLTEVQDPLKTGKRPILLDFDFRYKPEIKERQHTPEHIIDIVMCYADEIQQLIDIKRDTLIDVYVMERENPTFLENKTKDGVHIIFDLNMDTKLQIELRNRMLLRIKDFCEDLPLTNTWEEVLDKGIVDGCTNWTLIGSRKSENKQQTPYKVTQHLTLNYCNTNDIDLEIHNEVFDMKKHFWKLLARNVERPYFFINGATNEEEHNNIMKEKFNKVKKVEKKQKTITSTEGGVTTEGGATTTLNANDSQVKIYCELGVKYKIWEKMSQGSNRKWWINVGLLIKNDMGDSGEDTFVNLSRHDSKFNEDEVRSTYKLFNKSIISQEKKPITIASLIKYFKDTDKDITKNIVKEATLLIKKQEPKKVVEECDIELDPSKLTNFDSIYMNSFKDNYQAQKKYFEKFVCKVLLPEPQFIYIEGVKDFGNKAYIFTENQISTAFRHIKTEHLKGSGENARIEDVPFTLDWINDCNIRVYNRVDFVPVNDVDVGEQKDKTIFNLFAGYNPKVKSAYTKENKEKILKPFMDLGRELSGGVEKDFLYFLKFIAHMIQKPNEKIPICFIFKGKQGTGKSMFINAIGNLIGQEHYISSSNPKDFFGDYAEGFYHKLLVNMNECEGKDTFDFEGKIKSFISEDRITINPKNVRPTEINNLARVIISTNKPNPIPIDVKSGDRRYVVYQTTDFFLDKKYGTIFWTKLLEHFKKPEFIACLYDYFNELDISKVDWRSERPITEAYRQMCKLYVPIEALFFEDYVNKHRGLLIEEPNPLDQGLQNQVEEYQGAKWEVEQNPRNKEIYDDYVRFCKSAGFSNDKRMVASIPTFNNRCEELEIPHRQIKSNGNNEFRYTPKDIYNHLLKKKWINRDLDDPEIIPIDDKGEEFEFDV